MSSYFQESNTSVINRDITFYHSNPEDYNGIKNYYKYDELLIVPQQKKLVSYLTPVLTNDIPITFQTLPTNFKYPTIDDFNLISQGFSKRDVFCNEPLNKKETIKAVDGTTYYRCVPNK